MVNDFTPFANEADVMSVGGLNLENHADRVSVFGNVDLTRDKVGLAHAQALKSVLDATIASLQADAELPDEVAPPEQPTGPRNPFS